MAQEIPTGEGVVTTGKELFDGNCKQCHQINKKVVGPQLANVYKRQNIAWLINFIKYPQKVIESGDAYAVGLYKEYKQYMPNHDFFSDEEILSILAYIKAETENPTTPVVSLDPLQENQETNSANNPLFTAIIIGLTFILAVFVLILIILSATLTNYLKKEKDLSQENIEFVNQRFNFKKFITSSGFVGLVTFILLAAFTQATLEGLYTVGVQQGYAPDQPIPFSHKLHAGFYEIPCQYCHTTVEKSKNANIPSANICMNCHNTIRTTSPNIQKIYQAIENNEPIQWVRVHNLPDLAYFNHSQHVKVAGLECETCHGDIKNMEIVQQHSLLTMGWCVDCHRNTVVEHAKDNDYYSRLVEMHENTTKKEALVVEDIGGLECSKCHY